MWSDGNYMQARQPLNRCIKFCHIYLQSKTLDLIQSAATSWSLPSSWSDTNTYYIICLAKR